jgi:hypothetical protein
MADIDPELQKRLNGAFENFSASCRKLRDEINKASFALNDLAFELDSPIKDKCRDIVTKAIEKARN